MNRVPLTAIAPEVFRKRLIVEGYFRRTIDETAIRGYFDRLTDDLGLRTYGAPIVHRTSGQGRAINEGFDGFVPLIDSGIYLAVWVSARFLSTIIYTCGDFDEGRAVAVVRDYFHLLEFEAAVF